MAQFEEGNNAAEKWTEEEATKMFQIIYDNAEADSNILCIQDAFLAIPMRGSTFYYLIEKFPVLDKFKKDIQDVIISRVNKEALRNKFNSTASIWRMKQLGERDEKSVDHTTGGDKFEPPIIKFK